MTRIFAPQPKPPTRLKQRAKQDRIASKTVAGIRSYIFARERDVCRICRVRRAESMHELVPRSLGGKVSRKNSVALCGSGTTGCHGFIQAHRITFTQTDQLAGAESTLWFTPRDDRAADWLRIKLGERIESPAMVEIERAE